MKLQELANCWYMAWACIGNLPMLEHLRLALQHFRRKHGRAPSCIAVHRKENGLPEQIDGVEIIEAPGLVRDGEIHLYF